MNRIKSFTYSLLCATAIGALTLCHPAAAQTDAQIQTIQQQIKQLQNQLNQMKADLAARDRAVKAAQQQAKEAQDQAAAAQDQAASASAQAGPRWPQPCRLPHRRCPRDSSAPAP